MLPQFDRGYDDDYDLEPATERPSGDRFAGDTRPEWDDLVDEDEDDPLLSTQLMPAKHGSKSSTRAVVKPRVVPPPFPFPSGTHQRVDSVSPASDGLTWAEPAENVALPPAQHAVAFRDRFVSEIDDPNSDEMPVVHGHPMVWKTPDQIHQAWLASAQAALPVQMAQLTAQTSGVQAITHEAPSGLGKLRVMAMWMLALVLGAATMLFWHGDVTEHDLRVAASRPQDTAVHIFQAIRR